MNNTTPILHLLPPIGTTTACPDYDEDCDLVTDHANCWINGHPPRPLPCPYLD